jgi:hypothetical protein
LKPPKSPTIPKYRLKLNAMDVLPPLSHTRRFPAVSDGIALRYEYPRNSSTFGGPKFMPPDADTGAPSNSTGAAGSSPDAAVLSSLAAADGCAAAYAPAKNVDIRNAENAAVAIILTLDLIVASRIARRDSDSISSPDKRSANRTYRTPNCLKLAETTRKAIPAIPYGTLMTVFTMVTDASKASSLPLIVVIAATPEVETEIPA